MTHKVTFFKSFPLEEGQKIKLEDSPLKGDWEVVKITDYKITLRCPISKKELVKDRFFFFTEEKGAQWPSE